MKKLCLYLFILILLTGCTSIQRQRNDVRDTADDRISIGTVQREIKVGMSSSDVVSILGSPNMVTTDNQRRETWVYDKVATENVRSSSSGGLWLILAGMEGKNSVSSSSQRTLTIIIKFDEQQRVRDFSYRQSSF